ncbi:cupin domain-containing protein [Salinigranum salinum]|uniref:cupin domain-containing protein n=1 Tax=Salinigranum salinum TaxID=1364937 RepID=UPI00195D8A23|nr:cupin domain-containing protein [Salinigranum salinum]
MSREWNAYDVSVGPLGAELVVAPDATEAGVAVVEHTLPPRTLGAPLHRHEHEDEISVVLSGVLGAQQGEEVSTAGPGEVVAKPRGVWHTFWNDGDEPLRFLEFIAPGAFAGYFEEVAAVVPEGPPDEAAMRRLAEIAGAYDLEMDPGSMPELVERHGLER